jgi:hypothetical protein
MLEYRMHLFAASIAKTYRATKSRRLFRGLRTDPGKLFAMAIVAMLLPSRIAAATGNPFELANTDITIFAPETDQVIGHGHYRLTHLPDAELIEGDNKYLDGEYDRETQRVQLISNGTPPLLINYQHSFYNADGTPQYIESLDGRSGAAVCQWFGPSPDLRTTKLTVPPDTYAGATQLALLVGRLRQGARDITFHSFNCLPAPKIIAVKASTPNTMVVWPKYPGDLLKLEMIPDFGWLNAILAPFVPRFYGWFDPGASFNYVGGQFARFYKGRQVLMVRTHAGAEAAQSSSPSAAVP